ncbi:hypothetical protein ABZP36_030284 [Zizania latifolia]
MYLSPSKLDIDELLADFTKIVDGKEIFIYIEGRPKTISGAFMQSLFLHCIGHMTAQSCLPQRLAGLYCLYCLYETQPYKPHFKIYLSLGNAYVLTVEKSKILLLRLIKMAWVLYQHFSKGMILFGFINLLGDSGAKQIDELTASQNKSEICMLFTNTQIESYMHMDLGLELELDKIKKSSMDYAKAKELAFAEASHIVDVEDARHIVQHEQMLGYTETSVL